MSNNLSPLWTPKLEAFGLTKTPEEFMKALNKLHRSRDPNFHGIKSSQLGHKPLDYFHLYKCVIERGGVVSVIKRKKWRNIADDLGIPVSCTNAGYSLRKQYMAILFPYEAQFNGVTMADIDTVSSKRHGDDDKIKSDSIPVMRRESHRKRRKRVENRVIQPVVSQIEDISDQKRAKLTFSLNSTQNQKILMALESHIEIQWALQTMLLLSSSGDKSFVFDQVPGLLESFITVIAPHLNEFPQLDSSLPTHRMGSQSSLFNRGKSFERGMMGLSILRNAVFIDANAVSVAKSARSIQLVVFLLSCSEERARMDAFDVFAAIAPYVELGNGMNADKCICDISSVLSSGSVQAKATVLDILRSLCRNDANSDGISKIFHDSKNIGQQIIDSISMLISDPLLADAAVSTMLALCESCASALHAAIGHELAMKIILNRVEMLVDICEREEKEKEREEREREREVKMKKEERERREREERGDVEVKEEEKGEEEVERIEHIAKGDTKSSGASLLTPLSPHTLTHPSHTSLIPSHTHPLTLIPSHTPLSPIPSHTHPITHSSLHAHPSHTHPLTHSSPHTLIPSHSHTHPLTHSSPHTLIPSHSTQPC